MQLGSLFEASTSQVICPFDRMGTSSQVAGAFKVLSSAPNLASAHELHLKCLKEKSVSPHD